MMKEPFMPNQIKPENQPAAEELSLEKKNLKNGHDLPASENQPPTEEKIIPADLIKEIENDKQKCQKLVSEDPELAIKSARELLNSRYKPQSRGDRHQAVSVIVHGSFSFRVNIFARFLKRDSAPQNAKRLKR